MTEPSGARLPRGNVIVLVSPRARACSGDMITSSGSTPSCARRRSRRTRAALGALPPVERRARAARRMAVRQPSSRRPSRRRWSITSGTPPAMKTRHRRVVARAVRQHVDDPRDPAVDVGPVVDGRPAEARRVGDRREVEQEVRGAAEGGVDRPWRSARRASVRMSRMASPRACERDQRARGAPRHVQPDRLARRREGRVRQGEAERLADDLGRRRRAEELAAAARPSRTRGSPCRPRARA